MQPSMDNQLSNYPKMKFNKKHVSIFDLPEELLAEILKRLPVKSIYHCMFVQKTWYFLIKTPMFITLHFNHQKTTTHDHPKYLLFQNVYCGTLTLRYDDLQCGEYCTIEDLPGLPSISKNWCAASYGLMCVSTMFFEDRYYRYDPSIYLWNPLVRKSKTLPDSDLPRFTFKKGEWQALAFGFVPDVNDYVVVHIVKVDSSSEPDPHSVKIGVYSLNTNTWRNISRNNASIDYVNEFDVTFVNGSAYWVGNDNDERIVMCFDTKTDILRQILLPPPGSYGYGCNYNPTIHPFGQSLAYFVHKHSSKLHMYLLKDDPINGSVWEEKRIVSLSENVKSEALGLRNNGEPIVEERYNLISYNHDNNEAYNFVDSWNRWTPNLFQEDAAPTYIIDPFIDGKC